MVTVLAAQRLQAVAVMYADARADAGRYGDGLADVVDRSIRMELAAALRITEYAAGDLIALALAVVRDHPAVHASLSRAGMTEQHADILVRELRALEPEHHERVRSEAIALAETLPVGTFRRALRKLVETVRSVTLTERHEAAVQNRRMLVEHVDDGMAWLHLYGPAVEAHAVHARVTAIAKVLGQQDAETRTLDQLRSDVVFDLLIDGHTAAHPENARGIRASVAVTTPVLSLLDDAHATAADPPVVEGIGPIPIQTARELCGSAHDWMRILTHPETGIVLSVGRDRYKPPPSLRKLVRWRADRCMAPGCHMPASRCEIDHNTAWEHGGHTSLDNLCPLCKGHHTVKHHGGWRVQQIQGSGGAIEWVSPTGRRYVVEPERSVPVFTPDPAAQGTPPF